MEKSGMKITVNNVSLSIFEGAKVKDAMRMYYAKIGKHFPDKIPVVRDTFGHRLGLDGALLPDSVLYIGHSNRTLRACPILFRKILKHIKS